MSASTETDSSGRYASPPFPEDVINTPEGVPPMLRPMAVEFGERVERNSLRQRLVCMYLTRQAPAVLAQDPVRVNQLLSAPVV